MIVEKCIKRITSHSFAIRIGYVSKVQSGAIEATGPLSPIGGLCLVENAEANNQTTLAEVISVESDRVKLIPFDKNIPIMLGSRVTALDDDGFVDVGDCFSGRAVDAVGRHIDEDKPISAVNRWPAAGQVLRPLDRSEPSDILSTGIRALDGALPIGVGQRIGIFAASGVGKTTLIRQLAAQVDCDRCVLCLVGERGKEVEQFWSSFGTGTDREKYTCVSSTSDQCAALRVRAVNQALAISEYWRSKGKKVLLIIDSVTRYAMALREVGLAAGEPPTLRAYTPNVFAELPRLVERCGAAKTGGAITSIMTVLSETDDVDDPIVEAMKSLLDGHIVLSRKLAERAHFPAIDVLKSVSRQSERLMSQQHALGANSMLSLLSAYDESEVLIQSGIYKKGASQVTDRAIEWRDEILQFLKQTSSETSSLDQSIAGIMRFSGEAQAYAKV